MEAYSLDEYSNLYQSLAVMYFAFTSLSTVGFGDFNPKSEYERLLCAFILLFGVSIFSYILGIFNEIIVQINSLNEDLDDGDQLTQFFGLMQRYNGNKKMNKTL